MSARAKKPDPVLMDINENKRKMGTAADDVTWLCCVTDLCFYWVDIVDMLHVAYVAKGQILRARPFCPNTFIEACCLPMQLLAFIRPTYLYLCLVFMY